MICSNCGVPLDDNSKFCVQCGTAVSSGNLTEQAPHMSATHSTPNQMANGMQPQTTPNQMANGMQPQTTQMMQNTYPNNSANTKDKIIKIVGGIVIASLLAVVAFMYSEIKTLEKDLAAAQFAIEEYEDVISAYENRSTLDKTGEALEGWLEYLD